MVMLLAMELITWLASFSFFFFERKLKIPEFKASSPDDQALVNFSHFIGVSLRNRKPPYVDLLVTCADGSEYTETWKQIALMDFASHKKRMSVVLECVSEDSDCYGQIYAFIKGADSELMKNIWGMDKFSAEPASRYLKFCSVKNPWLCNKKNQ